MRCNCDHCIARDAAMGRSTLGRQLGEGRNIGRPPIAAQRLAEARKAREEIGKVAELIKRLAYHSAYGVPLKEGQFAFDDIMDARRILKERVDGVDANIARLERVAR